MSSATAATRRKTVLVVEDDRTTSDLIRYIVESEGLRFVPASEGLIALDLVIDERPSLITLDLDLPDTDGHRVLHRLISDERTRDIPIILVTAHRRFLPEADCHRVAAVLEKPFEVGALAGLLHQALDGDDAAVAAGRRSS